MRVKLAFILLCLCKLNELCNTGELENIQLQNTTLETIFHDVLIS